MKAFGFRRTSNFVERGNDAPMHLLRLKLRTDSRELGWRRFPSITFGQIENGLNLRGWLIGPDEINKVLFHKLQRVVFFLKRLLELLCEICAGYRLAYAENQTDSGITDRNEFRIHAGLCRGMQLLLSRQIEGLRQSN